MKTLRVLLVSVISFCLLNVQMIMTTQGLKVTSNVAYAQDNGDNGNNGSNGNTTNVNSTNYQTTQTYSQQEASTEDGDHGLYNQLMMLAIGFIVAGWFTSCIQPLPMDMIIAAVGAGVLIIGEIVAITMYQGTAAKMEMAYQADHEGKMLNNDDQVESFRKELENNEEIKSALETKLILQIAAEVVFIAALALAITISIVWHTVGAVCIAGSALATCPGPCQVQCSATAAQAAQMFAKATVPKESASEKATSEAESATVQTCPACIGFGQISRWFYAGCFPVAGAHLDNKKSFPGGLYAMIEKERPEMSHIAKTYAKEFNEKYVNPSPSQEKELMDETALEMIAKNGIGNWDTNEFVKHKLNSFPTFNIETEDEIDYYIKKYEWNQYLNGKISSITISDYQYFKDLYNPNNVEGEKHYQIKDFLVLAAEKGLDIFVPKAEANFGKLLTILGGALAGYLIAGSTIMKLLLGTATRRAIVYGIFGGIVALGISETNKDIEAVESNIDKLKQIINNLSDLNGGPIVTHTGAPTGSGSGKLDRPQIDPQSGDISIELENNAPTPCLAGESNGKCENVKDKFKAASAIDGLTLDSNLNSTANTIAGIGDDISGTRSLSGNTLGKLKNLGGNKGALNKINRSLMDRLAADMKKNKLSSIDFDKEAANWKDKMQKAFMKKLKEDGKTPAQVLASSGIPALNAGNKGKDDKALNDAKQALAAAKGKDAGKGKAKAAKIGFDFGDNKAGVAASDQAGLDDPNKIGADEEYVLDDIVDDKGASLWQIISVRYLKSGYNRLKGENKTPQKISE